MTPGDFDYIKSEPGDGNPRGEARLEGCTDSHTLKVMEMPQLLLAVASLAQSPQGKALLRSLRPTGDLATIKRRQRRLGQVREILEEASPPGLDGMRGIEPLFSRLEVAEAMLLPEELERVISFLGAVSRGASFLDEGGRGMDEVYRLRNRITPLSELAKRLRSILGPGNSVATGASSALKNLRGDISSSRDRLRGKLGEMLTQTRLSGVFSDQVVTQRAERFVVPVKADAKGRVKGIIHGASGSGATCFMEPLEAVEDNNRLAILRQKEQEEEIRILKEASAQLAANLTVLRENLEALAKLDCLLAQASFCRRIDAHQPELNREGPVEMIKARHPLLAWRALTGSPKAVPIHINLDDSARVLMISGANAGGKTAALKTMGLINLMAMCGMHTPMASGSRLRLFRRILAEIGDEQDLERQLSTFTAHAGRLGWMMRAAGPDSLLLVDEIGGGTDPGEGAALAVAVLERFMALKARVICTTHFHRLKAFAELTSGVINVSVAFDQASGQATYQLLYGSPGFSDALAVGRQIGLPYEVLSRAESLLDQGERETVELLRKARADRQEAAKERDSARVQALEAAQAKTQARKILAEAKKQRAGALSEGKRRVREVARRMEKSLEELLGRTKEDKERGREFKPGQVRQELYKARRDALGQVERSLKMGGAAAGPSGNDVSSLKKGAGVKIISLDQNGVLLEDCAGPDQTVAVSAGVTGVRLMVAASDLEPVKGGEKPARQQPKKVAVLANAGDGLDLKVIGMTVDEALPLVDKALDQALVSGKPSFRIVHGNGTGRLRTAVRQYLKRHPMVSTTRGEPANLGGAGVTVAELRI